MNQICYLICAPIYTPTMFFIKIVFFFSLFMLFFSYLGYGILLWVLVKCKAWIRGPQAAPPPFEPPVTLVVAAYNEAGAIRGKISNTLGLDYPEDKLDIIFITDGSTDNTPDIIREYPRIQLMHESARRGKTAAINRAMLHVKTPFVIFCDANTLLNNAAIRNIVKHYTDERTGGVAGEKKVITMAGKGAEGAEGIYWKYESTLKRLDAELYTVVGAAGELFSLRTELYMPMDIDIILDDFMISMKANLAGYRIAYAPDAYAMEAPSASIAEEHKRKVRISAGGFQSIVRLTPLFNIFRHPVLSFQYICHRVLRWTLAPLSLPLLLIANILLVASDAGLFYNVVLTGQLAFYMMAVAGFLLAVRQIKFKPFYVPFYFVFMNIAIYEGFFRYIQRRQSAVWEKAKRGPSFSN